MRFDRNLSPPIAHIERRLFGVSDALILAVEREETSPAIAEAVRNSPEWSERAANATDTTDVEPETIANVPEMPIHLRDLIRRRLAAEAAMHLEEASTPIAGQIVEVREIVTPRKGQLDWIMQVPLYVLLDASAESDQIWYGWLVSGEADYAGWFDFVLQEEDEPFVPEAGVVQLWNPVRIYMPMAARVVGRLSPARLQAVRALAAEYVANDRSVNERVWPGRIAARSTTGGLVVATGSPLGGNDDPRHRYQSTYFHAAEAIRQPARLALEELADEKVGNLATALLKRLMAAASQLGQELALVPRIAVAMNSEEPEQELEWKGVARIGIVRLVEGGGGQVSVTAIGTESVTCELRVAGVLDNKLIVRSGDGPVRVTWDAEEATILTLIVDEGKRLDLVLTA